MASYRLYCLDGAGRISLADWIEADSDEDAVAKAGAMKNGAQKCEIWQLNRLVARINGGRLEPACP
jgi:hypothetical protein